MKARKNTRKKKIYIMRRILLVLALMIPISIVIFVLFDSKPIDDAYTSADKVIIESTELLPKLETDKSDSEVNISTITSIEEAEITSVELLGETTEINLEILTDITITETTQAIESVIEEETTQIAVITQEIEATYIDGVLIVNKTYALPQSYNPGGLTSKTSAAFVQMQNAAATEGLNLYISSGFRSYDRQKTIFNNNVNTYGRSHAETFSARPGHSEHQTGLAFDINIINDSFANTPEAKWVAENAHFYGFVIRYPKGKEDITGYKYEPWHLRYLGEELATELYESEKTLEEHFGITSRYEDN